MDWKSIVKLVESLVPLLGPKFAAEFAKFKSHVLDILKKALEKPLTERIVAGWVLSELIFTIYKLAEGKSMKPSLKTKVKGAISDILNIPKW